MMKIFYVAIAMGLLSMTSAFASEIREFDLKTIERLGAELARVSQTPDRGATTLVKKRARETGSAALRGKLYNIRYDYVVLNDPDGSGFLVYALVLTNKTDETVLGGHFRVSVSADGSKVERIDELQREIVRNKIPSGAKARVIGTVQMFGTVPVETWIYSSDLYDIPIFLGLKDGSRWQIWKGKMHKFRKAELDAIKSE